VADYFGVATALSYNSGRSALHAILAGLGVGLGDEVILPGFTCIAVPAAVVALGAIPVYADIDPQTFNVLPAAVSAAITARTKIILAQHTFGIPCEIGALGTIAAKHGLFLIEDCAHALGAQIGGRYCGTLGNAGFLSTEHSKMISTVRGGIAITNDEQLSSVLRRDHSLLSTEAPARTRKRVSRWRRQLFVCNPRFGAMASTTLRLGRKVSTTFDNWVREVDEFDSDELKAQHDGKLDSPAKLPDELARIGLMQLKRVEADVIQRNRDARRLEGVAHALGWKIPKIDWLGTRPAFLRYPVLVDDRAYWRHRLYEVGIEAGVWFTHPIHPAGSNFHGCGYRPGSCPNAEMAASHSLNIPLNPRCSSWIINRVERLLDQPKSPVAAFALDGQLVTK
jgi:dTDP-4-amino-4,6-dideoxygalactose transaminase